MQVWPEGVRDGVWNWSAVTKSCNTVTSLLKVTTAISTRFLARLSFSNSSRNVCKPALRAVIFSPDMEYEVSSKSRQGQRGSGLSANSIASWGMGGAGWCSW